MKKRFSISTFLFLIFSFSMLTAAQNNLSNSNKYDSVASSSVSKLQQKILLSDKQTSEIKGIVLTYIQVKANLDNSAKLFAKIEPLLDSRQKIKFEIINNDWWNSIVKEIAEKDSTK